MCLVYWGLGRGGGLSALGSLGPVVVYWENCVGSGQTADIYLQACGLGQVTLLSGSQPENGIVTGTIPLPAMPQN